MIVVDGRILRGAPADTAGSHSSVTCRSNPPATSGCGGGNIADIARGDSGRINLRRSDRDDRLFRATAAPNGSNRILAVNYQWIAVCIGQTRGVSYQRALPIHIITGHLS